jgi:hypothetical protein
VAPLLVYPLSQTFHLRPRLQFQRRKELISLITLIEKFNLDNLYRKPRSHAVSKAFPISKNTASVNKLLLELKVTAVTSHIEVSFCGRNGNQTGLQ